MSTRTKSPKQDMKRQKTDDDDDTDDYDDEAEVRSQSLARPGARSQTQQPKRNPRKNFTLSPEQEETMFKWLQENDQLWRRGHMLFKDPSKKKALWDEKGKELGVTPEHLRGWWRGLHTWYVKLHKQVECGQPTKKLTDREKYIMEKCSFYEGELRHRPSAPTKQASRDLDPDVNETSFDGWSDADSILAVKVEREDEFENNELLSNIENSAVTQSPVSRRNGVSRSTKRTYAAVAEEEETLREIRDSIKVNTQLLSQLISEKSSSPREPFINYVADSLRRLPDRQYDATMRIITSVLQNSNTSDFPSTSDVYPIAPATRRTRHSDCASPHGLYQT